VGAQSWAEVAGAVSLEPNQLLSSYLAWSQLNFGPHNINCFKWVVDFNRLGYELGIQIFI